jgi:hypothetical protein
MLRVPDQVLEVRVLPRELLDHVLQALTDFALVGKDALPAATVALAVLHEISGCLDHSV